MGRGNRRILEKDSAINTTEANAHQKLSKRLWKWGDKYKKDVFSWWINIPTAITPPKFNSIHSVLSTLSQADGCSPSPKSHRHKETGIKPSIWSTQENSQSVCHLHVDITPLLPMPLNPSADLLKEAAKALWLSWASKYNSANTLSWTQSLIFFFFSDNDKAKYNF